MRRLQPTLTQPDWRIAAVLFALIASLMQWQIGMYWQEPGDDMGFADV